MKGKTKWYPRRLEPVRNGEYECIVRISCSAPLFRLVIPWDSIGFLVETPMMVIWWRGLTKKAYWEAMRRSSLLATMEAASAETAAVKQYLKLKRKAKHGLS